MRLLMALAVPALLALPQEPSKITLEKTATVQELTAELSAAFHEKITLDPDMDDKRVPLQVRDAGLLEALDAVCRAHGGISVLQPDSDGREMRELVVKAEPWVEYPAAYSGAYRFTLVSFTRVRMKSELGDRSWTVVNMVLSSPPSFSIDRPPRGRDKTCTAAVDQDGHDVLPPPKEEDPLQLVEHQTSRSFLNTQAFSFIVQKFNVNKKLQLFEGKVGVEEARLLEVPGALEPGTRIDTPRGRILVQSLDRIERDGPTQSWVISLKFEPAGPGDKSARRAFETGCQIDKQTEYVDLPWDETREFQIRCSDLTARPKTMKLRVRLNPRTLEVPFSFKDAVFK